MVQEIAERYFPPLQHCLNGENIIVSWKKAFLVVSEFAELYSGRPFDRIVEFTENLEKVRGFLTTTKIENFLSETDLYREPWTAFHSPDSSSKTDFDDKTAAINVTPSADGKYDLAEIKEDALYLSRFKKIDEISALRIVVLEFQSRARNELLLGMREEEVASLRNIMGSFSNLSTGAEILGLAKPDAEYEQFSSQEARRDRILRIYYSEREYFMKTSGLLHKISLQTHRGGSEKRTKDPFVSKLGDLVDAEYISIDQDRFLLGSLNALGSIIDELCKDYDGQQEEATGVDHARCRMTEAVCYMEIIFQILDSVVEIPSSKVILRWFQIFAPYSFLDKFSSQHGGTAEHMKCLISVISLTILKLSNAVNLLTESSNVLTSGVTCKSTAYVLDVDATFEIHNIIFECANQRLATTSPLVFAWFVYLSTIREALEEFMANNLHDGFESDSSATEQGDSSISGQQPLSDRELPPKLARYEEIYNKIIESSIEDDPMIHMARSAVCASDEAGFGDSLLFEYLNILGLQLGRYDRDGPSGLISSRMRVAILDFISHAVPRITYGNAIVVASLAATTGGQQYWDLVDAPKLVEDEGSCKKFIEDPILMDGLFGIAANRQPYERTPFLKFALALAACRAPDTDRNLSGGSMLDDRNSFTHTLSREFRDFETKHEEDNNNLIVLTRPIEIFSDRQATNHLSITDGAEDSFSANQFIIPAGTNGRLVSEDEPRVAIWFHSYSGYAYLGKLLESYLNNSDTIEAIGEPVDEESVADIIDIFATLLLNCKKLEHPQQAAQHILERASEGLSRTHDLINVVFALFEQDLDYRSVNPGHDNFLGICISSVHFIHALMHFMPGRVWPFLVRSRLLDTDGRGSKLSEIVTGTEIVQGHFSFLISSIRLFDSLVEDSVSHAVSRKGKANTSLVRYSNLQDLGSGIPDQGLIRVINQFTSILIDVFGSLHNWKPQRPEEHFQLFQLIASILGNIIRYVYGVDDSLESKSKLASPLTQAARRIVESFLSPSPVNLQVQVILHTFVEAYIRNEVETEPAIRTLYENRVATTFRLTINLIKLRSMLELPPSQLETQLFGTVALLIRLHAANDLYRPLVLALLKELVVGASDHDGEPPSLIAHLRPETTKSFLTMLSAHDSASVHDSGAESEHQLTLMWQFFSAVVSNRQRTLAIILLTGKTPRQALKTGDSSALLETPFLSIALDMLSAVDFNHARTRIDPPPPAIAMLEFVSQAQDFWPLQMGKLQTHPDFIRSISSWVENLETPANRAEETELLGWCYSLRMASFVAEILAMYLFRCREMGDVAPVKEIIPRLRFFKDYAVRVPNYNSSLHGNLQRNFEAKYEGLNPLAFKKTRLGKGALGANYFYDILLSNKMLKFDQAWEGRRDDGLFSEFIRANINLSIVDAQIALLHGWKFLAIELRNSVPQEPDLQRLFAKITTECLVSNKQEQPPEHIFDRLMQTRTDFALMTMQTLLDTRAKKQLAVGATPAVKHVLERVWETVQNLRESLDIALSAGDAQYYRSLLKLLYLALQAHAPQADEDSGANAGNSNATKPSVSKEILIALEVANHVVARGFRDMVIAIHDKSSEASPEDIFLLTNILAACLRIPNIGFCHDQIINHMVNNEAARVAVTLFSWSDRLAIDGDPIYGELSIGFLLELSRMKAMAEQIAVDGVLGQIGSAGLSNYLRRGNVSPFAEGVGPQRCYDIWVRGILPLLLNLLYSIGSLIGAEVAIFLNQFTPLLQTSLKGLEPNDTTRRTMSGIVLKPVISRVVSEINTLALIHHILKDYRSSLAGISDIPEVPGLEALEGTAVLENAEFWLASRKLLRERIVPMGQKELELSKQKALRKESGCENRLEERIVEELAGIRDILTPVNGDA